MARMLRRVLAAGLLLAVATAATLGAAAAPAKDGGRGQPRSLNIGAGPQSESLDPHRSTTVTDARVLQELFLGLTTRDAAGNTVPGAAARWEVSPDGLTWVFHLRPDGRWSDGSPVTADDFVFAWRRALTPGSRALFADLLYPVRNAEAVAKGELPPEAAGVRAVDPLRLEVRLERPKPNFADYLYHRTTYPLHRASLERHGEGFVRPGALVGNGPYRLAEAVPQSLIRLERNPFFHDAANVAIGSVTFHVTEDQQAELLRYRAGELDVTYTFPGAQTDWLRSTLPDDLRIAPLGAILFLAPNLTVEPWKSHPGLRRALSLAIDREVLAERVVKTVRPSYGFVPGGVGGYRAVVPDWAGWSREQREREARRLYAAAGYGPSRPLTVELLFPSSDRNRQIAVAIAAMWDQVLGVRTSLVNQEQRVVLTRQRAMDYPGLVLRTWQWAFPERYLELLRSRETRNGNGYANPAFDRAMEAADAAVDPQDFLDRLRAAETIALADDPVIPLTGGASGRLVSPALRGWVDNPVDTHLVRWLSWAPGSGR